LIGKKSLAEPDDFLTERQQNVVGSARPNPLHAMLSAMRKKIQRDD
jgi:hypothetical protein